MPKTLRLLRLLVPAIFVCATLASANPSDPKNLRLRALTQWKLREVEVTGSGVQVAIVDSGVQADVEFFMDRLLSGWSFIKNAPNVTDLDGHGTAVAGILRQLAPDAMLLPLAVTTRGSARSRNVVQSLVQAIDQESDLINASLGISDEILKQVRLEVGVRRFDETLIVVAAGNFANEFSELKEAWPNVVVVGATPLNLPIRRADYSAYGEGVDIAAPAGAVNDGIATYKPQGELRIFNGTSAAAPVVASALALLKSARTELRGSDLKNELLAKSCQIPRLKGSVANAQFLSLLRLFSDTDNCVDWPSANLIGTELEELAPPTHR